MDDEAIAGFWSAYQRFDSINNLISTLATQNPDIAQVVKVGTTYEGRELNLIKIGINSDDKKPVVFIEGGIHAREWISPATVTYFAQYLVNGYNSKDADVLSVLNQFDIHILPSLNADGYEYSQTTVSS